MESFMLSKTATIISGVLLFGVFLALTQYGVNWSLNLLVAVSHVFWSVRSTTRGRLEGFDGGFRTAGRMQRVLGSVLVEYCSTASPEVREQIKQLLWSKANVAVEQLKTLHDAK
jgi:hypothetical protein